MANFVRVGDSPYVINLEQVAWVRDEVTDNRGEIQPGVIEIVFTTTDHEGSVGLTLRGDNAERFMAMLNRQTGVW